MNQTETFLFQKIEKEFNETRAAQRRAEAVIRDRIDDQGRLIIQKFTTLITNFRNLFIDSLRALEFNIDASLTAQTTTLIAAGETFYNATIFPLLSGIGAGVTEIVASTSYISATVGKLLVDVESIPETIEGLLNRKFDEFKEYLNDWKKELIEQVAQEVSLQIVGESYYRWDATSTYYPTLTFLFKEENTEQYPKRSQIKVRLNKKNEEVTDADISMLKRNCNKLINQRYTYGTDRYNYVSADKRYKTTVFGSNVSEIISLFTNLLSVLDEPFLERNLSITFGRNRINQTKRSKPLGDIKINEMDYQSSFSVKFYKAVLLVNGLEKPIILAKP